MRVEVRAKLLRWAAERSRIEPETLVGGTFESVAAALRLRGLPKMVTFRGMGQNLGLSSRARETAVLSNPASGHGRSGSRTMAVRSC